MDQHSTRETETFDRPLTVDDLERRRQAGWHAVSVVWERDAEAGHAARRTPVPYGLRVGDDAKHLEVDPDEMAVLRLILAGVVRDRPLGEIAADLASRNLHRRDGGRFTQSDLFELLPRVVDEAPSIYASAEWRALRGPRAVERAS